MNINNVQPAATSNGQTQTPSLATPSDSNLFNANPSDIDFFFDEKSGNFMMDFKKPQTVTQPDSTVTEKADQPPQQQSPSDDKYEGRFSTIENALIRLAQSLESNGQQQVQPQQTESQNINLDVQSDDFATNLVNIINNAIEKKFEEKLTPINKNMGVVNDRMLLTDLAFKYGNDFTSLLPAMTEYKKSDPNANWEQMFLAMRKVLPTKQNDSTTRTTNGSETNAQPQVDLAQRAQQMATVRNGVAPNVVAETPKGKMSIAQIVEQSIQELTGN